MTEPNDSSQDDSLNACSLSSNAEIDTDGKLERSDEQWQRLLNPEQYRVLRQQGTEPPFQNAFWNLKDEGLYRCAGCGETLFDSSAKYDSGSGWPSFYEGVESSRIGETVDTSHGMTRTEVHCAKCGGHLGHVFPDGPKPTGLRYCINSASLAFVSSEKT